MRELRAADALGPAAWQSERICDYVRRTGVERVCWPGVSVGFSASASTYTSEISPRRRDRPARPWQARRMKWPIAVLTCVVMGAGCGGGNESGRGIAFDSASGNDEGPGGELDDEGTGGELDDEGAGGELDDEGSEDGGTGDGRIAFRSKVSTDFEIFVMNADGTEVRLLTENYDWDFDPAWSPDGERIAFHSVGDEDSEIFVINADGSEMRQLTDNDDRDFDPAWSPDGERIAFASDSDGDWEIFVMNADGTEARQLTDNDDYDSSPAWSPDGKRIAFDRDSDGHSEIFVMNADGTEERQLTNDDDDDDRGPAWSPDGERIAFWKLSEDPAWIQGFSVEIFVMNADGTDVYSTGVHGDSPSWGG